MRAKQRELLRDLAKLLAKYSTRDWEPIVRFLRVGKSKIPEMTAAIESLDRAKKKGRSKVALKTTSKRKATRTKQSKVTLGKKVAKDVVKRKLGSTKVTKKVGSEHQAADQHLEAWTRTMLAGSPTSELQELYFKAVGSKHVPVGRDAVIRALMDFLRTASVEQRTLLVNLLQRRSYDATDDYRRWTAMISSLKTTRNR